MRARRRTKAVVHSERARHDVLQRMRLGLFLRQDAGGDLLVDPGVVVGQTRELAVAVEVRAAVAHVREREKLLVQEAGHDRGAHSLQPRLRGDGRHHALVGLLDGDGEAVAVEIELVVVLERPGRFFLLTRGCDEFADRLDRDLGGDFARGVPAHAVRHDEESFGFVEGVRVLVVLALLPDVRQPERFDRSHPGGLTPCPPAAPTQPICSAVITAGGAMRRWSPETPSTHPCIG